MMVYTVDSSESTDDDLFSPVLGRAASQFDDLMTPTPDSGKGSNTPDTLPRLHNTSWIGARVSPVPQDDEEDDDEDIAIMAPYHKALQQASFVGMGAASSKANEQTTLLGRRIEKPAATRQSNSAFQQPGYPTPLENGNGGNNTPYLYNQAYDHNGKPNAYDSESTRRRKWWCPTFKQPSKQQSSFHWFIPATTALFLSLVGLHDLFLKYISWRRGTDTTYSLMWNWWVGPSERTMLRFGAFSPSKVILGLYSEDASNIAIGDYWRILTGGLWATSSVTEWIVIYGCWCWAIPSGDKQQVKKATVTPVSAAQDPYWNNPYDWNRLSQLESKSKSTTATPWQLSWPVVYILSTLTGQLWMVAFDYWGKVSSDDNGEDSYVATLSGCTSWGTAGVLCAKGMQLPEKRLEFFCWAIVLVVLHLLQPTASVFGAIGAAFFGWAFASVWAVTTFSYKKTSSGSTWQNQFLADSPVASNYRGWTIWNGLAAIVAVSLWVVPIVNLIRNS